MNRWSKFGTYMLVGLIGINVAGTVYHFVLEDRLRKVRRPPVVEVGEKFPVFSGVDVRGAKWEARGAPCRVIRITDDHCAYCKKDKPSYATFLDAARRASCEIIELAPRAGQMAEDSRPGIIQLKYVDADVALMLYPFATPETVILGGDWSLKLLRRGIFDDKSLASSIALLDGIASGRADGAKVAQVLTRKSP